MAGIGQLFVLVGLLIIKPILLIAVSLIVLVFTISSGNTIPGESNTFNLLSILTSLKDVVTPAWLPTGQALELFPCLLVNAFIIDDFPTFGYPITPQ